MRDKVNDALINNAIKALKRAGERAGLSPTEIMMTVEQELFPMDRIMVNEAQTSTLQPVRMSAEEQAETIAMLAWEASDKNEDDPPSSRLFSLLVAVARQYVTALMEEDNKLGENPTPYLRTTLDGLYENLEIEVLDPWRNELVTVYAIAARYPRDGGKLTLYTWVENSESALRHLRQQSVAYPSTVYSYHEVQVTRNQMHFTAVADALNNQLGQ